MVRALAGDSTTTSVLPLREVARAAGFRRLFADAAGVVTFLRFDFFFFVVFAIRSVAGSRPRGHTMPSAAQHRVNTTGSVLRVLR